MRRPFRLRYLRDLLALLALLAAGVLLLDWSYRPPRSAAFTMDTPRTMLRRTDLYNREEFADQPRSFRWTDGSAQLQAPNPGGAPVIEILLASGPAGRHVPVTIASGPTSLTFDVGSAPRSYALLLPPDAAERFPIRVASPTLSTPTRTLGVIVSDLEILGGGAAPWHLLLLLIPAIVGGYLFLRGIGLRAAAATAGLLLLLALLAWWQAAGGWRYTLLGKLLPLLAASTFAAVLLARRFPPLHAPAPSRPAFIPRERLVVAAVLAIALAIRLPWLLAPDPIGDLEMAARRMGFLYEHGFAGAYMNGGDYVPFRLYLLRGLAQLVPILGSDFYDPVPPATHALIKLPGLLADLATIVIIYVWSRRWRSSVGAAALAALYALAPPIWIDVAWWGQVDALLMLPMIGAVLLLDRAGGRWSWLCWAVALLIKPQAIILAPLLYVVTLRRFGLRALALGGSLAVGLVLAATVPLILAGQGPGLMEAYLGSVERFPRLTNGAYNLWYLKTRGDSIPDLGQGLGPLSFRVIGFALMACATLLVCLALLRRSDGPLRVEAAAVLALSFFLLPTQIHERYVFLSLAFLTLRAAGDGRLVVPIVVLTVTGTVNILGTLSGFSPTANAAIRASPLPAIFPVINLLVLLYLMSHMLVAAGVIGQGRGAAAPARALWPLPLGRKQR